MRTLSKKKDIVKIMSFGDYDFEININITENQARKYKLDLDQIKSISEIKTLLAYQEIKENITLTCNNELVSLLLLMNKTNNNKIFIEYLCLNTLYLGEEFTFLKYNIISDFDDCFLLFKETNIKPQNSFYLNFEIDKKKKSFKIQISSENKIIIFIETQNNDKKKVANKSEIKNQILNDRTINDKNKVIDIKIDDAKKFETKIEESKKMDLKKEEPKKEEPKKEEPKKEDPRKDVSKKEEPKKEEPKKEEYKKEEPKKEEPKKEEPRKEEHKKEEPRKEEHKKEEHKKEEPKKEESKKEEPKKEESKKDELKKEEPKKEEPKKDEPKKEEPKKEELKKEEPKKEEPKKEESKKEEPTKEFLPKKGLHENLECIKLPKIEKPNDILLNKEIVTFPEGREENEENDLLDYNHFDNHKQSPLILTKRIPNKSTTYFHNDLNYQTSSKNNISNLNYDFESCDYIIIDLNIFIENTIISLDDIYNYLCQNIIQTYMNTSILLIFPSADNITLINHTILLELIAIADIMIFERCEAVKLSNLMGYKEDEKNFEVRFMFLKELRRSKYKPHRTAIFLDDFNKFTVIIQETDSNLIVLHQEYNFNIGFKIEYFNTISTNFKMLKSAFLGGFLSRTVQNNDYDYAFSCGDETFKKLLDSLFNKIDKNQDPNYFIIIDNDNHLNKVKKKKKNKSLKSSSENNFLLDSINVRNSKLKPYDPFKDKSLRSFFDNKNVKKNLKQHGIKLNSIEKNSDKKRIKMEYLKYEQNKYLTILEKNQILQKQLVNYLSSPNKNQETLNSSLTKISKLFHNPSNESTYNRMKLPQMTNIDYHPFQKIENAPDYLEIERKKINLKPIKQTRDNSCNTNIMNNNIQINSTYSPNKDLHINKDIIPPNVFNSDLLQKFISTMPNNGFNNLARNNIKPLSKLKTSYKSTERKNIENFSSKKELNNSNINQAINHQVNLSPEKKSKSRSKERWKKKEEVKEVKKVFEPKGQFYDVDNTKTIEQIKFEEEYNLKKIRKRELEMKVKFTIEGQEEEERKMKNEKN